jgi:hypothetical protein
MARTTFRDAVFEAMHRRLQDAFPELVGESAIARNPANDVAESDAFPCLRCHDGPHINAGMQVLGEATYHMTWTVEGCVVAPRDDADAALDQQMNDLHARIIEAIVTTGALIEVPLVDGWLEIEAQDTEFNLTRLGVTASERPTNLFSQEFALSVEVPRGTAYVDLA